MTRRVSRREMLKGAALFGVGYWIGTNPGRSLASPNEKLDVAFIGIGGRGRANLNAMSRENVVALCDVDDQRAGDAYQLFPEAKKFYDFRRMFDKVGSHIDAVVISTPDHAHFHPARMALELGKHLYLEKPMAHSVQEVRTLTRLAAEKKLATQLGVQRHTHDNVHRVVELVRSGAIGDVRECHAWVGGNRGMPAIPTEFPPVPSHLKWDLWLGPATKRPYSPAYAPYNWRFWWDFGTGETGNWGCHVLDIPYWALELKHPVRVDATGPPVHPQTTPRSLTTRFDFPSRGKHPPVTLHWYHTDKGPPVLEEKKLPRRYKTGVLFVGAKGLLICDFGRRQLLPESAFEGFEPPARTLPDSPGFHREWIDAVKGGEPATCNFDYSGPMTETILLGNLAYRIGGGFDWEADSLKAPGRPEVDRHVRPPYRKGWEV
ncbi:MAG: Gfo/Idh/MocA family oxidoreductase [Planctomycetota bacterium]|nr:Gfo/Idh/MocA family oxidoreductase [Planctomycetota bacterium]